MSHERACSSRTTRTAALLWAIGALIIAAVALPFLRVVVDFRYEQTAISNIRSAGGTVGTYSLLPRALQEMPGAVYFQRVCVVVFEDDSGVRQGSIDLTDIEKAHFYSCLPQSAHFRNVAELDLCQSMVSDNDLGLIATLPQLRDLDLGYTAITDVGMAALGAVHFNKLSVASTAVTDNGVACLSIDDLRELDVSNCCLSNSSIRRIATGPRIERLDLGHPDLGDSIVTDLCRGTSLRKVTIANSGVTFRGIQALRERRPDIEVTYYGTLVVKARQGSAQLEIGGLSIDNTLPAPSHRVEMVVQLAGNGECGCSVSNDGVSVSYSFARGVGVVRYVGAEIAVSDFGRSVAIVRRSGEGDGP